MLKLEITRRFTLSKTVRGGQERPRANAWWAQGQPQSPRDLLSIQKKKRSIYWRAIPSPILPLAVQQTVDCLDFLCVFPIHCRPQLCMGLKGRMTGTLVGTWAGGTKSTCPHGLLLVAIFLYAPIPIYLIWDLGSQFSLLRLPGELRVSTRCAGTGFGSPGAWFRLLHHSQYDLEANHLNALWPFPQLEHCHSTSVRECELN